MGLHLNERSARLLWYFSAGLLLLGLLSAAFLAVSYRTRTAEYEQSVLINARYTANYQNIAMTEVLNGVLADLLYLSDTYETRYSLHESSIRLEADFLLYCRRKRIYDQIRVIDTQGNETLRINYSAGDPSVVPQENLQDKSGRYYFQESIALGEDAIYLSPIDLNIENGEIEVPHKPMLRIAAPLFIDGERAGVLVLNFLAEEFLGQSFSLAADEFNCSQAILNPDSEILRCDSHPELEFLFMFPDEEQVRFRDLYPEEAEVIYGADAGDLRTAEGLFVWQTVKPITDVITGQPDVRFSSPLQSGDDYFWKLVIVVTDERFAAAFGDIQRKYARLFLAVLGPVVVLAGLAAWLLNRNREYRLQIHRMAQYDELTGLPNRRFLAVFGEKQLALAQRQGSLVGVLFLDLDGFKPVNDQFGHAAGDAILREMAKRIPAALRIYDLVFGVGGDEFVVVLQNLQGTNDATIVGEKIIAAVNRPIEMDGHQITLGVSIGASFYPEDETTLDDLVQLADDAMYRAKGDGRNRVSLHSRG